MMNLSQEQCIQLCKTVTQLKPLGVQQDKHQHQCLLNYINELGRVYNTDILMLLKLYEANISMVYVGVGCWSLPGLAYLYLSLYGVHNMGWFHGVSPNDILYPSVTTKDGKVTRSVHPLYKPLLEPEGMSIWFKWMYALINPEECKVEYTTPNPNCVLTALAQLDLTGIMERNEHSSLLLHLEGCLKAPLDLPKDDSKGAN